MSASPPGSAIERVGVIGLGSMGMPIVRHLVNKGFRVVAYDVRVETVHDAEALGATVGRTPREVAQRSELTIVVVGLDSEVQKVVLSDDGLLAGASEKTIIAIAATVEQETVREIGAAAAAHKVSVLDTPLCRGDAAAEQGELLLMGGGDKEVFDSCRPVFEAFAEELFLLGALGAGQIGKMVNNLLLWTCISANYEGLKLAESLGVESETLRGALLKSSGNNWALETWLRPRNMPWAEKDMDIVLHEANAVHLALPLCSVVKESIKAIKVERGLDTPASQHYH